MVDILVLQPCSLRPDDMKGVVVGDINVRVCYHLYRRHNRRSRAGPLTLGGVYDVCICSPDGMGDTVHIEGKWNLGDIGAAVTYGCRGRPAWTIIRWFSEVWDIEAASRPVAINHHQGSIGSAIYYRYESALRRICGDVFLCAPFRIRRVNFGRYWPAWQDCHHQPHEEDHGNQPV